MTRSRAIAEHYTNAWQAEPRERHWRTGPIGDLPNDFAVLEFAPSEPRNCWTYATCGMSRATDAHPIELHLHSPWAAESHVELLTVVAHYHVTGHALGLGHTVKFGRPWLPSSGCSYGLISQPYLDGSHFEWCDLGTAGAMVRLLWLLPITEAERECKKRHAQEQLESRLDTCGLDYCDPYRASVAEALGDHK